MRACWQTPRRCAIGSAPPLADAAASACLRSATRAWLACTRARHGRSAWIAPRRPSRRIAGSGVIRSWSTRLRRRAASRAPLPQRTCRVSTLPRAAPPVPRHRSAMRRRAMDAARASSAQWAAPTQSPAPIPSAWIAPRSSSTMLALTGRMRTCWRTPRSCAIGRATVTVAASATPSSAAKAWRVCARRRRGRSAWIAPRLPSRRTASRGIRSWLMRPRRSARSSAAPASVCSECLSGDATSFAGLGTDRASQASTPTTSQVGSCPDQQRSGNGLGIRPNLVA
mmetsp:Transcript_25485/g.73324  ORF Transcript_25485/g.73324 Transcript_25485/m.73324 type:complete len:283 (+) Transcript_25485:280-1128(+)